jgi:hypothetical protein
LWRGISINNPWKIYQGRQSSSQGIVQGEQRGAGHYACVTGSDVIGSGLNRNEVTWPEVTSLPEAYSAHARKCIPAFFYYSSSTTPRTIKITPQGESPTFDLMTSLPVTSLSVTSHPLAMLLSGMSNGTFYPDHFMPWVHPFTSMIAGPTGSGKSMFVRRFVPNIKHMMTPKPDRILWCYGEYQTLNGIE